MHILIVFFYRKLSGMLSGGPDSKSVRLGAPGTPSSQYEPGGPTGEAAQRKNHSQIEKKRRDRMNTYIKVR